MIGFIGLGDIGLPMAHRLLDTGAELIVWNRTAARADTLVARGARLATSPEEVMAGATLIGLCLTSHHAVKEIAARMFAVDTDGARRTIVDLSTGAPEVAAALAAEATGRGIGWVDAPVSGGVAGAINGTLTLFVGGAPQDIDAAAPLFDILSARRTVLGGPGAGQAAKICNQMIVACSMLLIGETLASARATGLDVSRLPEAMRGGFADSTPLQIFGPRMATHSYEPRLGAIALLAKDLGLARDMVASGRVTAPISQLCAELYAKVEDPEADISRLIELFEARERPEEA